MAAASSASQPAGMQPLVEVLTFAGCPNRDAAIALVERVAKQLGGNAEVRVIEVPDQQTAEQLRFLGSPTIRVNGGDIEPAPTDARSSCTLVGSTRASTACTGCPRRTGSVRRSAP
jgi:hypothetical protein